MPSKQHRVKRQPETYQRWRRDTAHYHHYSSRRTVNFTGSDKRVISRKHRELAAHVAAVEDGRATFVPASAEKIRHVKKTGQYITTNKGFFVYAEHVKKVSVRIVKKGRRKMAVIKIDRPQKRDVYYSVSPNFYDVNELAAWIFETLKPPPNTIRLAIDTYSSTSAWHRHAWDQYAPTLQTIEEEIKGDGYETPFNGIFATWHF